MNRGPSVREILAVIRNLFLALQGLVLLFDVPISLSQTLPTLLRDLPILEIAKDWSLLVIIGSILNGIFATLLAVLCLAVARFGLSTLAVASATLTRIAVSVAIAAAINVINVNSFPAWRTQALGLPSNVLIAIAGGVVVAYAVRNGQHALPGRLVPFGRVFSGLALIAIPFTIAGGVMIVGYPYTALGVPLPRAPVGRPNIVIVLSDALRATAMGTYGETLNTTPQIDRLARDGTVFDHMTSVGNYTVPTTATLYSGVEPFRHHVTSIPSYFADRANFSKRYMLPQVLRSAGYTTAEVAENILADPVRLRIAEQFTDIYVPPPHCDPTSYIPFRFYNSDIDATFTMSRYVDYARKFFRTIICMNHNTVDPPLSEAYGLALGWLDHRMDPRRPFLLWVHTLPPHRPYLPPQPFIRSLDKSSAYSTLTTSERAQPLFYQPNPGPASPQEVLILSYRYLENVRYADAEFARFFHALQARHLLSSTIVIFTADHGETFRRWLGHDGPYLDQDLIHIPFIMWGPGVGTGRRVDETVSQLDIAPTILGLAGLKQPTQMTGRSLVPLLHRGQLPERAVYATQLDMDRATGPLKHGTFSVIANGWKYVEYLNREPHEELFDLKVDESEATNLASKRPDIAARLRCILKQHFHEIGVAREISIASNAGRRTC